MEGSETISSESTAQAGGKRDTVTKKCVKCQLVKTAGEFKRHKLTRDKLDSWCKECASEYSRWWHLARKHGITREFFFSLLKQQNGACPICTCKLGTVKMRYPDVDHDHRTGRVRGLLCRQCNVSLGLMKENPERFERAAAYIRQHRVVTDDMAPSARQRAAVDPDGLDVANPTED